LAKIRIENLVKRFGDVIAVDHLSLEVPDKEFLVLLGPSGCGKTTVLRCLAGLEAPDEGEVYVGDRAVTDLPPRDRDMAMVFQSYALYPHRTVFDNIAFPLEMKGMAKGDIDARVKRTADLLRIGELLKRKPRQLSGGEAQRVALGRAIVREPKAFLMDEPLSNLDAKLRLHMRAELKRLQRDLRITTVYVTHDQAEAMTMGDRIAILNQGSLQQLDGPLTIYNTPRNSFVAGFVGSPPMNLVDCTFVPVNGGGQLDFGPFKYRLPNALSGQVVASNAGPELIFGVHPENVQVSKGRVPEGIECEVYAVEPLGSEVIVDLRLGEALLKAKLPTFPGMAGERVWMSFNHAKINLFDRKSGKAIA
jgi:multiple sugar transport system ATP-binding protein